MCCSPSLTSAPTVQEWDLEEREAELKAHEAEVEQRDATSRKVS